MGAESRRLELAVVGAGYVGLVMAACLAKLGHSVRCVDQDADRINQLRRAVMPFHEPGLAESVRDGLGNGRLCFETDPATARGTAAILVAVGTLDRDGEWTSEYVETAVTEIAGDRDAPRTIVIRSTLMPGSTERLDRLARSIDPRIELCFNPEFTRQGSAVADFLSPDRIVIGTVHPAPESNAVAILGAIYAAMDAPLIVTDAASAEMIKVGSNVFLALKIGFANEIARLSAATGADVSAVVDGIGLDGRIGRAYMTPGPGFGGSCLPSQARALPAIARDHGVATQILDAIDESNRAQAAWVVDELERAIGPLEGRQIALLGLTFKAGTDDVRESPSLAIARGILGRRGRVVVHDAHAEGAALTALGDVDGRVTAADDPAQAVCDADAVVIATDWPEYRELDWAAIATAMSGRTVLDTRSAVDAGGVRAAGLTLLTT